jgi:double-stranded uracil-DNA glycosylase
MSIYKPTKLDLENALDRTTEDLLDRDLKVLFCGINPGIYSAATGFHFARPGNRFWKVLHLAGFTDRQLDPSEEHELLGLGYGITSLVSRTTARADQLTEEEYVKGGKILVRKIKRFHPRMVAFLGIGAFRTAFGHPTAKIGLQAEKINNSDIWLLPNPSGLNANYQVDDFVKLFRELKNVSQAA